MKALEIVGRRVSTSSNRFSRMRLERHAAPRQSDLQQAAGQSWKAAERWMDNLSDTMFNPTRKYYKRIVITCKLIIILWKI